MIKICVVSGTRADYGLLYWTIKSLCQDNNFQLQLCVTGMHLSPEFGLTYRLIEEDGFVINKKVELLMSSDTSVGISKSVGIGIISFSEVFLDLKPDIVLLLGDRFEIFAAATAAMMSRIPIAHCHGGEITEGAIDESIRHSITKMAHLHFTSSYIHLKRVIQLGENPSNVFNVGALGVENIIRLQLYSKKEFEKFVNFKLPKRTFLITYHPVTLENLTSKFQFQNLLNALDNFNDNNTLFIFSKPNSDHDGRIIIDMIDEFVKVNKTNSLSFVSMGQKGYLSAIKYCDVVLGNSSSGIIEAPYFKKPTINIGDRQKGRQKGDTILDCSIETDEIIKAIKKSMSIKFKNRVLKSKYLFGNGDSSKKIIKILSDFKLDNILKKEFYNI